MRPRLHVLLGSGGVGKTTLAAGYALALAERGGHVGLLGIDPSRRLQGALGMDLADLDAPVPGQAHLRAAIVHPHQSLGRWVAEASADVGAVARLEHNPFFAALGDHLATAIDVLAAARIGEWVERDAELTDLVVDTAPGVAALDFLRAPRQVEALVKGPLVRGLRAAARAGDGRFQSLRSGASRVLGALARVAGAGMIADLADFFALVRAPMERMLVRVERAERLLRSSEAELLLVTSPSDTAACGAAQMARALAIEGLGPRAVIVNRTRPPELAAELAAVTVPPGAEGLVGYARAHLEAQAQVVAAARALAPSVLLLASQPALDQAGRQGLGELGESLRRGLVSVASVVDTLERTSPP